MQKNKEKKKQTKTRTLWVISKMVSTKSIHSDSFNAQTVPSNRIHRQSSPVCNRNGTCTTAPAHFIWNDIKIMNKNVLETNNWTGTNQFQSMRFVWFSLFARFGAQEFPNRAQPKGCTGIEMECHKNMVWNWKLDNA